MSFTIRQCKSIAETEKAILVESEDFDEGQQWIPQSQIDDDSEIYKNGQKGNLTISDWFAEKLDLI